MLQLTLIRHAKSDWGDPSLRDFDRPLNARGLRDAPMMGELLKDKLGTIDQLLSSPALRALTTATLLAQKLDYPEKDILQEENLYNASKTGLLEVIQTLGSGLNHCALVAHNPGLSQLANFLAGNQTGDMATCTVASFIFELDDWRAVTRDMGQLVLLEHPKKYSIK